MVRSAWERTLGEDDRRGEDLRNKDRKLLACLAWDPMVERRGRGRGAQTFRYTMSYRRLSSGERTRARDMCLSVFPFCLRCLANYSLCYAMLCLAVLCCVSVPLVRALCRKPLCSDASFQVEVTKGDEGSFVRSFVHFQGALGGRSFTDTITIIITIVYYCYYSYVRTCFLARTILLTFRYA